MSGSSCDGIDAALVAIQGTGETLTVELLAFTTCPYDDVFRSRLLCDRLSPQEICLLNVELGERLAVAANSLLSMFADQHPDHEKSFRIDFVASHGHTLAHVPATGSGALAGTFQIGEPAIIAERLGAPVVSHFRGRDMAAGGQGAPLVPYVDWLLFRKYGGNVACLNIGGIANVTVVTPELDAVLAFDTGPGNMPIDAVMRKITNGRKQYDSGGAFAAKGAPLPSVLEKLLAHPFFEKSPPKSTGREDFGSDAFLGCLFAETGRHKPEDIATTATCVASESIVTAFRRFVLPNHDIETIVVSGGGAHNTFLLERIQEGLDPVRVRLSDEFGYPVDAREAIAFAILGNETLCGTPANAPSATGASRRVVLGQITPA